MTSLKQQQHGFEQLTAIYDTLDHIVDVLADTSAKNIGNQLPIAKEFVYKVGCAVDEIADAYCNVMKRGGPALPHEIQMIETSASKIITEMEAVLNTVNHLQMH